MSGFFYEPNFCINGIACCVAHLYILFSWQHFNRHLQFIILLSQIFVELNIPDEKNNFPVDNIIPRYISTCAERQESSTLSKRFNIDGIYDARDRQYYMVQ